jgi:hypothetical protein
MKGGHMVRGESDDGVGARPSPSVGLCVHIVSIGLWLVVSYISWLLMQ